MTLNPVASSPVSSLLRFFASAWRRQGWRLFLYLGALAVIVYSLRLSYLNYQQWRAWAQTSECFCPACAETGVEGQNLTTLGLIKVEIAGAVQKPGIYQLQAGQRLADLVAAAGGFSKEVAPQYLAKEMNLAKTVTDQSKVYIPFAAELTPVAQLNCSTTEQPTGSNQPGDNPGQSGKISLNQASQKELETLPDIGSKRASDIIAGRPYEQLEDLMTESILSETIFNKIKDLIAL